MFQKLGQVADMLLLILEYLHLELLKNYDGHWLVEMKRVKSSKGQLNSLLIFPFLKFFSVSPFPLPPFLVFPLLLIFELLLTFFSFEVLFVLAFLQLLSLI